VRQIILYNLPSLQSYNENLTSIFGEPIYQETSHKKTGSVVMSIQAPIQTEDSYTATGVLQGVGNVTDTSTFVTTHLANGKSSSEGDGIISTDNGQIVTYTGKDIGVTDDRGVETYKGIQIFKTNFDSKLAFLDNVIGMYVYRYAPNGTSSGTIWEWK
jgi:hypothetical protein